MPASSLFADLDRPVSTPFSTANSTIQDQWALELALELSLLGLNGNSANSNTNDDPTNPEKSHLNQMPSLVDDIVRPSQNMTECVAVPSSEHVAEIVGRQGCKIKALRAKTNTYIKTPVRGEEPVFVVTGRKEDVAMAKREILSAAEHFSQIRACRKNNLNGSMAPGPPTNVPGQVTIQVRVPYRVVGLVVGPKGATIKRIQQQTHTYIVTPSRDKEPIFEVTGLPESVDQARKEIEAHIAMRTGSLLDEDEAGGASVAAAAAAAAAVTANGRIADFAASANGRLSDFNSGTHSLENLFASSDLVSSLYKLNSNTGSHTSAFSNSGLGLHSNGTTSSNTLNNLSALNNLGTTSSLGSIGNSLGDFNYLLGDSNSLLGKSNLDSNALFSSLGTNGVSTAKFGHDLNGLSGPIGSSLYSADEGLGSLGSSMGSSPSFDPVPVSNWSDLGRVIGSSLASGSALPSNFSSLSSSSLTRRSSSLSGASPPSSRLSPTPEVHPPARRISSDPVASTVSVNSRTSPSSTPELTAAVQRPPGVPEALDKRCRSCGEKPIVAALVPCGHNLFCMECAQRLVGDEGKCHTCGEAVSQAIRIFS